MEYDLQLFKRFKRLSDLDTAKVKIQALEYELEERQKALEDAGYAIGKAERRADKNAIALLNAKSDHSREIAQRDAMIEVYELEIKKLRSIIDGKKIKETPE